MLMVKTDSALTRISHLVAGDVVQRSSTVGLRSLTYCRFLNNLQIYDPS
jgi:hypothetical protein